MLPRGRNLVAQRIYTNPHTVAYRSAIGYRHRGLTFSSESKAWWSDPALGHHILGVHSEDQAGFVMIQPRRLSVIGTSVTPRHI